MSIGWKILAVASLLGVVAAIVVLAAYADEGTEYVIGVLSVVGFFSLMNMAIRESGVEEESGVEW